MLTKDTKKSISFVGFVFVLSCVSWLVSAQTKSTARDLEGVWSYATLTPFERPDGVGEFFTAAQAAEFEAQTIGRNDRDRRDGGAAADAARGVADFWFDRGEHVGGASTGSQN